MSVSFESVYRRDVVAEPTGTYLRRLSEEILIAQTNIDPVAQTGFKHKTVQVNHDEGVVQSALKGIETLA